MTSNLETDEMFTQVYYKLKYFAGSIKPVKVVKEKEFMKFLGQDKKDKPVTHVKKEKAVQEVINTENLTREEVL